jgi:flagellar hook-length control protein FliK
MDTGLPTISNVLMPDVAAAASSSKQSTSPTDKRFTVPASDNTTPATTSQSTTTDNILADNLKNTHSQSPQDPGNSIDKVEEKPKSKKLSDVSVKEKDGSKSKKGSGGTKPDASDLEPKTIQNEGGTLAQESTVAASPGDAGQKTSNPSHKLAEIQTDDKQVKLSAPSKAGKIIDTENNNASPVLSEAQASDKSVMSAAASKCEKLLSIYFEASNPAQMKSQQAVSLSKDGPVQTTADNQNQTGPKAALQSKLESLLATDGRRAQDQAPQKTQVSGQTPSISKDQPPQTDGKGSIANPLISGPKPSSLVEKSTSANGTAASDVPKPSLLNNALPQPENKPSANQTQVLQTDTGKIPSLTKEPAADKTQIGRDTSADVPLLARSSNNSGNELTGNPSGNLAVKNVNVEKLQVFTNQTKENGNSFTNNNSNNNLKQVFATTGPQSPSAEQPQLTSSSSKPATTALLNETSENIGRQIQESIYSSLSRDRQQITIRLNPPELGKVSIKFQQQDNQIIGLLQADKAQTRVEIQQALPEIIQNLQSKGVQIRRIDVLPSNEGQQTFRDQSFTETHYSEAQQQNSHSPDTRQNYSGWTETSEWPTNIEGYSGYAEPQFEITNDSINMLV